MKKLSNKDKRRHYRKAKRFLKIRKKRTLSFREKKVRNNPYLQNFKDNQIADRLIPREKEEALMEAPSNLALFDNTDVVIAFIESLKAYRDLGYIYKKVIIDLSKVTKICVGSVNMLLSIVKELGIYGVSVGGNLPEDLTCNAVILKSGYLEHMANVSSSLKQSMSIHKSDNMILMKGSDKTENAEVGKCIKKAIKQITGEETHYPPVYTIVQEMNGNSVEHAYIKEKKHWLLGINYIEDRNKVAFTFTDNGLGILGRLERKFSKKVFETLKLTTNPEILKGVFDKKYNSRFKKQINRNKGLPVIKKTQEDGRISNLQVIANNVYLSLDSKKSIQLGSSFSGTFYYWEVDAENVKKWKTR